MNYKEFNVALPIHDNNVVIIDGIVQYDTANIVNVRLMDGTEPFDFTGYTNVFVEIMKPDGTHVQACATGNPNIDNDNNPYTIQILDPSEGRIAFTLKGQATILTGTHFCQLVVAGDGKTLSSARFNYYVGDAVSNDVDPDSVTSSDDYASLRNMIAQNSLIAGAEESRVDAETLRKLAEIERANMFSQLENDITEYLQNATGYVEQTEDYMEQAEMFAELAQNPSAEIITALVMQLGLVTQEYVDALVSNATSDFDAGSYLALNKLLQIRRGSEAELPNLQIGELGWSTDSEILYVGGMDENVPVSGTYIAGEEEPSRTDILWIDTSNAAGNSIKYHDGTEWQPTATATFA